MLTVKTLETIELADVVAVFNDAFADYFVPFHVDQHYLYRRWRAARVDYKLSAGVFEESQLVGFLVIGIDELHGKRTAYNAATGVVPAYRGKHLVKRMYEAVLPLLQAAGVKQATLEVITQNEIAIKAYTGIGYSIRSTLLCFSGVIKIAIQSAVKLTKTKNIPWERVQKMSSFPNTWEASLVALRIASADYECWYLEEAGNLEAFVIVNPGSGFIGRLGFASGDVDRYGNRLLAEIGKEVPFVKINNVDRRESELIRLLLDTGLENHINQYEMVMDL